MEMVVPSHGIWGTAGIDGLNIDKAIHSSNNVKISVPSIRLEDVVKEDVLLLKVDVEGWEWSVMKGAQALLKNYNVENIIMEYSPGVPERNFRHEEVKSTIIMLMDMIDSGYRIGNIGEQNKHDDRNLSAPLETLMEVTKGNLVYDLEDARRFKAGVLGCPIPKELFPFPGWQLCMGLPEDASPYSFRSILGHNTNIWAAKPSSTLHPLKGVVGMMVPGTDNKVYFVEPGELGMGSRVCAHIDPKVWRK
ncbi:hypothetical protein CEUSTIGMA_g4630.t1 [Chlamydomonas eustigma]|uniref:Methyltransferase FkbM domain-containing protein n=1 Tax=Chlamydomonas eustigma TaxID=1157962 RepID=A0A250X259_9CHLO|nr:hypothetical protein CEUSTIGMA_g4630.t1 [Chlamydomonas eustigma]|eukprot:GAX77184.1 hypothetical protein CEUSTIGMA_g4630.t1 [Chlamydomonas eustigma]